MTTNATAHDILVVGRSGTETAPAPQELGFEAGAVTVSPVGSRAALRRRLATTSADCLLCDATHDRCLDVISAAGDAVPVVVFAPDREPGPVADLLEAGAADVVRARLAETPPALVRRRVEGVLDAWRPRGDDSGTTDPVRDGRLYEAVVDASPDTAAVYDEHGRFVVVNDRLASQYDTTPADLQGERSPLLDVLAERTHGPDPFEELVAGRRETFRTELGMELPSGEEQVVDIRLSRVDDDGEFVGVVGLGRNVTQRRNREAAIARQRDRLERIDRLNAVIRDVDQGLVGAESRDEIETVACKRLAEAGHYQFAVALRAEGAGTVVPAAWSGVDQEYLHEAFPTEALTAETSPGLRAIETGETQVLRDMGADPGDPEWQRAVADAGVDSMATVPVVHGDRTFGAIDVYKSDPDAFGERELAVLGELGETIGYAIAAVERRERERTLTALYEATRDLLGTETEREVCDVVVDVATEVLDVSEAGIFLFDDEENVLRPVSSTESFLDFYGGVETFGPGAGDSETWRAYMTGQTKVFDDVSQAEHVADPDTDARGLLVRPLDEHGTLVAASTEVGVFDSQRRKLVGLLAATAEAALDRVTGKARLRERDRQLEERARRLERFAQVAGLSRDVCRVAVDADDREALERGVCERLVRTADVAFAWVGTVSPDGVTLAARAWAGDSEGYLDATSLSADGTEPAARAAATGEVTVVSNVTDYLRDHDWARAAADRGYQSIVAVPLAYRETTYGVLTAYATDSEAFDDATDLLADLGDLVAYASNAVETERGVLADRVTELELRLGDGTNFLNAVADQAGTPVRSLGVTPRSDGRTEVLFGLDDAPVEAVLALDSEFVGVETLEHVGTDGRDLFRATLSGQTVAATLLDCGAVPETVVARPGHTDAVVSLPRSAEARVFFDRLEAVYPGAKLLARHDRSDHGDANARGTVDADLTDRQREVLETAFESGFFESPRETTGSELADILGVSQPTVTHHLREGQRRLFATLYGED